MTVLIDTNVLMRLTNSSDPRHDAAKTEIDILKAAGHLLAIVPQNIYEFWTAATRTQDANGLGLSPQEARQYIDLFTKQFTLHNDTPAVYHTFLDLMEQHGVTGTN